ncbi:hypothetical protein FZC79_10405 [Rossellomorea vietnamensis]|uniref:Uncharacterized protein n=1 Tax=Rossellomorea vietnamensis TaxID=218284 RepID=A0A5D4KEA0_9BACI|nr:hypothetical protein FZC79_10405 [Rossellomorea vietnamensis]
MPTKTVKLSAYYRAAGNLNEENPKDLIDKLSIYGKILELIGGIYGDAFNDWGMAEAERREIIANGIYHRPSVDGGETPSSDKKGEAAGELLAKEARRKEKKFEAEKERWRKAYDSTSEQINIMKKRYDHLVNVAKGGV